MEGAQMARVHYYTFALLSALVVSACVDEDEIVSPEERGQMSLSSVPAEQLLEGVPERSTDAEYARIAQRVPGFGGMFIDAGTPTVYLVDTARKDAAQEAVEALIREWRLLEDSSVTRLGIQVRQAEYDWLQLLEWRQRIRDFLGMPGVISLDIDDAQNRLRLGVETLERKQALEQELARVGVPTDAVVIQERVPVVPAVALTDRVRPVRGGLQIYYGWNCTLSFNTYQPGYGYSFVTASHCSDDRSEVDSGSYYQPSQADTNYIGLEVKDPAFFTGYPCPAGRRCRYSDANLSKYDSEAYLDYGYIARTTYWDRWSGSLTIASYPRFRIVDEGYAPVVGMRVYKMGRTTGWTGWDVSYTCEDIDVQYTDITLLCQTLVPAGVGGGDSGSPVFSILSGYNVRLWGVLWGRNDYGTEFAFSRIYQVEQELGSLPTELLDVDIMGSTLVPPNDICEWEADVEGGVPPYSYKWYREGDLVSTQYYYLTYDTGEPDTYWHLWVDVTDSGQNVNSDMVTVYVDYDGECSA